MYNRYIPQPDGSYQRKAVPDKQRHPPHTEGASTIQNRDDFIPDMQDLPTVFPKADSTYRRKNAAQNCTPKTSAGDFLRNLLPKNLDTGDLMIIILLLLMAGDCQEDQNNAILTLALYLFM